MAPFFLYKIFLPSSSVHHRNIVFCKRFIVATSSMSSSSSNTKSKREQPNRHKSKPGFEFNDYVKPLNNEIVFTKKVNSAFIGTKLEDMLINFKINTLVIVGMTTNHCLSSTVRMSGNLGFESYLVSDSTACFNTQGIGGKMIDCELIY